MDYASRLQEAYTVVEEYRTPIDERTKTQRLVDGMRGEANTVITMAKEKVKEDMLSNFMTAVTHLQTKISSEYPPRKGRPFKNQFKPRYSRHISQVTNYQGRGGRGRGGGGGGRGRGNFQGGRGQGGRTPRANINGMDISDPFVRLSNEE